MPLGLPACPSLGENMVCFGYRYSRTHFDYTRPAFNIAYSNAYQGFVDTPNSVNFVLLIVRLAAYI